jgi:hypothetical protein
VQDRRAVNRSLDTSIPRLADLRAVDPERLEGVLLSVRSEIVQLQALEARLLDHFFVHSLRCTSILATSPPWPLALYNVQRSIERRQKLERQLRRLMEGQHGGVRAVVLEVARPLVAISRAASAFVVSLRKHRSLGNSKV